MRLYVGFPIREAHRRAFDELTAGDDVWLASPSVPSERDRQAFLETEVSFGIFPTDLLSQAPHLRWVQLSSVGIDRYRSLPWAALADRVVCTSLQGLFADPMAQTVLAGILTLNRGIDQLVRLQERRDWQKDALHPTFTFLAKAHVLLLGNGSVCRRLRELLAPFRCTFTVYGRTTGDIHTTAELDDAIPQADIICAAMPETPQTRGLLDCARLARCRPGAILVNVGRGSLIDEAAVISLLRSGWLGGAVLDVTQREPLPPDDPLWDCPRLLLTQHTSAGSGQTIPDILSIFAANLARYRAGQPLEAVVDWTRGY